MLPDISYYTSPELIEELTKRTTFAGIVIRSENEVRNDDGVTIHQNWDITYSKLSAKQVYDLLLDAVEHFRELSEAEAETGE